MDEIYKPPFKSNKNGGYVVKGPWQTHPRRMARHKAVIQTARMALGYTGIYDEDEAERIIEGQTGKPVQQESITIDMGSPLALEEPKQQPELMQDLAQAEFEVEQTEAAFDTVPVQQEQHQQSTPEKVPGNAVYPTEYGEVSAKDFDMISQMINFTTETKSWKNTRDSFQERYSGPTLEYAEAELIKAQQAAV